MFPCGVAAQLAVICETTPVGEWNSVEWVSEVHVVIDDEHVVRGLVTVTAYTYVSGDVLPFVFARVAGEL